MTPAVLIVDAYNVIHDWWGMQDLADLGLYRERLLNELASYAATEGCRVIVVFDAGMVPGKAKREDRPGLEVYYSAAEETADTVIERLCYEFSGAGADVTVATSDRVQAQVVFGKGVYRLSAPRLKEAVERARRETRRVLKERKRQQATMRLEHTLDQATWARLEQWRHGR